MDLSQGSPTPAPPPPPPPPPPHTAPKDTGNVCRHLRESPLERCGWRVVGRGGWGAKKTRCTAQDSPEERHYRPGVSALAAKKPPTEAPRVSQRICGLPVTGKRGEHQARPHKPSARASEKAQLTARLTRAILKTFSSFCGSSGRQTEETPGEGQPWPGRGPWAGWVMAQGRSHTLRRAGNG